MTTTKPPTHDGLARPSCPAWCDEHNDTHPGMPRLREHTSSTT